MCSAQVASRGYRRDQMVTSIVDNIDRLIGTVLRSKLIHRPCDSSTPGF